MGDERVTGTGGRLRQLARHSFVYGLGGLVSKLVGIFLLPIYTHRVNQAQFGEVEQVMAFVAVAAVVLRMGLVTAMFRFCWDHREPDARARTISTAFTAVLVMSTVGLVLCLLLITPLADGLSSSRELVLIGAFGLWVSMNFDILAGIYRIEQRPTAFVVYSLINVALTVVLSIILVIPLDQGAAGIMLGNFSGTYITYALLLYARRETVALALDRPLLRRMLDFSLPLMPAGLALWALNLADRFQVINLASPAELGSYSAASKISLGIMLPIAAFQTAWVPFANSFTDEDEAKRTYRAVFAYWSALIAWAVVALSLFAPPYIHLLMPRDWWGAAPVVPLLTAGSALYGAYMILSIGVNRSKRTKLTPVVNATAAGINIGLNFLADPGLGDRRGRRLNGCRVRGTRRAGLRQRPGRLSGLARLGAGVPDGGRRDRLPAAVGPGRARDRMGRDPRPARAPGRVPARAHADGRAQPRRAPPDRPAPGGHAPPTPREADRRGRRARGRAGGGGAGVTTALSEEPARTAGRRVLRRNRRLCARPRGTAGAARRTA